MDWSNERYVRLYTRDTTTWKLFSWQARCVLTLLLRKVDRSGVIDVGDTGVEGLAAMIELPLEVAEVGIADLVKRKTVKRTEGSFVILNYLEAQEARQSDPQRARESRERRRAESLREANAVTSCHTASHDVTPASPDQPDQPASPDRETPARARARDLPVRTPLPTTEPPERTQTQQSALTLQQRQRINHDAWGEARLAHDLVRSQGLDPGARAWTALPSGAGANELTARTLELAEQGDEAFVRATHTHVIELRIAEARHVHSSLKYFIPSRMYAKESFWKAAELSIEQVQQQRKPAGASGEQHLRVVGRSDDDMPAIPKWHSEAKP